jgi:hypothetical protein
VILALLKDKTAFELPGLPLPQIVQAGPRTVLIPG